MPFYDAYTQSAFQTAFGRPMGIIPSQNGAAGGLPDECALLPTLIGAFTNAIVAFVRPRIPTPVFETLYPVDTNDTPLNKIVNYPTASWTAAALTCLQNRELHFHRRARFGRGAQLDCIAGAAWVPAAQSSHLVGISDYTTPWLKERGLALASGVESVVLFALDQFCLIGYPAPLNRSSRRSGKMG